MGDPPDHPHQQHLHPPNFVLSSCSQSSHQTLKGTPSKVLLFCCQRHTPLGQRFYKQIPALLLDQTFAGILPLAEGLLDHVISELFIYDLLLHIPDHLVFLLNTPFLEPAHFPRLCVLISLGLPLVAGYDGGNCDSAFLGRLSAGVL